MLYARPLPCRPAAPDALPLAGGWARFSEVELLSRHEAPRRIPARDLPREALESLTAPRSPLAGVPLDRPALMGILNVTPDSFSDGGRFTSQEAALRQAEALKGAAILDIGGESTRPGAAEVSVDEEIARTAPVIAALRASGHHGPISIDTRKAAVADAALAAGATMVNDVSALTFDPAMAACVARHGAALCLMHSVATPATMQADPRYDNVLLDVCDSLRAARDRAEAAGIPRARIALDPGIGFGKTLSHNLALLRGLSLFHGLGCALLLGVSRKSFIGTLGAAPDPAARLPGTLAVTLDALAQGVQLHRVHDVAAHAQALALWHALTGDQP